MKIIQCREHGGTFSVLPRRGRPPVRCTTDNPCAGSQASSEKVARAVSRVEVTASNIKNSRIKQMTGGEVMPATLKRPPKITGINYAIQADAVRDSQASVASNPSLPMAMQAKARLEPQGWTVKGRGWQEGNQIITHHAEVIASRGEELLILHWMDGELLEQAYNFWNVEKPSANGKPASKLGFDPDELSDRELVEHLSGMKVTWWNVLAGNTETAVIPNKLTLQHVYVDGKDGMPGDRIITFVDRNAGGFRTFRAGALMKVG